MGVDPEIAEDDACSMEHVMDVSTISKLRKFVEFNDLFPDACNYMEKFREYAEKGTMVSETKL